MIICQCRALNDAQVRTVVRLGNRTLTDIGRACGAGACCGGCRPTLEKIVREEALRRPHELPVLRVA